jgi:2-polyprenyl-3-methyl-5-hydroxy-6-metoxy-1,4-benzoquinol methylase
MAAVSGPPMRLLDRLLRSWRVAKVRPYLRPGCSVLDVGCHDGALFTTFEQVIARGVGIDPALEVSATHGRFRFIAGGFPSAEVGGERFDVITFLAVLEHVQTEDLPSWRRECERVLDPGGLIVVTVPSPIVDRVLDVLVRLRLVSGMSLHEHHGFNPSAVLSMLPRPSFELLEHRRFEVGMNHLYVFRRVSTGISETGQLRT